MGCWALSVSVVGGHPLEPLAPSTSWYHAVPRNHGRASKGEDSANAPADQRVCPLPERPEREAVVHLIGHERSARDRTESVTVDPSVIGAPQLPVREGMGRFPLGNLCPPPEWDTLELELVVDKGSPIHLPGKGREDPEVEFRGCDALEVFGVRKELKDFLNGEGKLHGGFEPVEATFSRSDGSAHRRFQSHISGHHPTTNPAMAVEVERQYQVGHQRKRAKETTP